MTFIDMHGKIMVWSTSKNHILVDFEVLQSQNSNHAKRKSNIGKNTRQISNLQLSQCSFQNPKSSAELRIMLSQLDFTIKHEA